LKSGSSYQEEKKAWGKDGKTPFEGDGGLDEACRTTKIDHEMPFTPSSRGRGISWPLVKIQKKLRIT